MTWTRAFPPDPASVSQARAFVMDALAAYHEDVIVIAQLGVSELAMDALRRSGTGFTVSLVPTRAQLRIAVTDAGTGKHEKRHQGLREGEVAEPPSDQWEVAQLRQTGRTDAFVIVLAPDGPRT